jgi:hypothetical protein
MSRQLIVVDTETTSLKPDAGIVEVVQPGIRS